MEAEAANERGALAFRELVDLAALASVREFSTSAIRSEGSESVVKGERTKESVIERFVEEGHGAEGGQVMQHRGVLRGVGGKSGSGWPVVPR